MEEKAIGKSKEDYLKAILIVKQKYGACRSVDISSQMNVSKSSTSIALKKLEEDGLVRKDDWRILLTEKGQELAEKFYDRNEFFSKWFREIGVSEEIAKQDACMIEHAISEETYRKLREYLMMQKEKCAV